jgi:hypothetical protein
MGSVALSAGYYLLAKLGMHVIAEYQAREFFDVDQVEVSFKYEDRFLDLFKKRS